MHQNKIKRKANKSRVKVAAKPIRLKTYGTRSKSYNNTFQPDLLALTIIAMMILSALYFVSPGITGLFIAEKGLISYEQNVSWEMNTDSIKEFIISSHPEEFNLKTFRLSGSYIGNGTINAYLETKDGTIYLILDNKAIAKPELTGITGLFVAEAEAEMPEDAEPDYEIEEEIEKAEGIIEELPEEMEEVIEEEIVEEEIEEEVEEEAEETEVEEEIEEEVEETIAEEENITEEGIEEIEEEINITEEVPAENITEDISEGDEVDENVTEEFEEEINITDIEETNITEEIVEDITEEIQSNVSEEDINVTEENLTEEINVTEANITQEINITETNITKEINVTEELEVNITEEINITMPVINITPLDKYKNVEITDVNFRHEWKGSWGIINEVLLTIDNRENQSINIKYVLLDIHGYENTEIIELPTAKTINSREEKEITIQTHFSYKGEQKRAVRIRIKDEDVKIITSTNAIFNPKLAEIVREIKFKSIGIETSMLPEGLNDTEYKIVFEVESGLLKIDKIDYVLKNLTRKINITPTNITNITYEKIKEDPRYDAIIDLAEFSNKTNELTVIFHHDAEEELPIRIEGAVKDYVLSKKEALPFENITLTIPNYNNEYFRIFIGEHTEIYQFGVQRDIDFNAAIKDSKERDVNATIEFIDTALEQIKHIKEKHEKRIKIKEGRYNLKVKPENKKIKELLFEDIEIEKNISEFIQLEDVPEFGNYVQVYAIDPTAFNFTNATVTVTAKGTALYKCKDWNFTEQECYGEWTKIMDITPGENYTLTLTPEDPGYGEINITDAVHLDANYSFISNIYDEVKNKDDVWSEPIYANQFVRVTYSKNLSNGNVIDVFVRNSNLTNTWFEVYNVNTTSPTLGSSGMIDSADGKLVYITLENVSQPADTFDFKILGEGALEFDYIHDAVTGAILPDSLSNEDGDAVDYTNVDELAPGDGVYEITGKSGDPANPAWIQCGYYGEWYAPDSFDTAGFGAGFPEGIATVDGSEFWIVDNNDDVYHVNSTGGLIDQFDTAGFSNSPKSIATVDGSEFWIADSADDEVYHVNSTGGLIDQFDTFGFGSSSPEGIATVDGSEFWIVDSADDEVYHVSSTGGLIDQFDTAGFSVNSKGIATVDGSEFWIVDADNDEVYHVSNTGDLIDQFDTAGFGSDKPTGIATVDGSEFWTVDSWNGEVYHITPIPPNSAIIQNITFYWGHQDDTNWALTTQDAYTGIVWSPDGSSTFYNVTDYTVSTSDIDETYTLTTNLPTRTQLNDGIYLRFIGYDSNAGGEDDLNLDYCYFNVSYYSDTDAPTVTLDSPADDSTTTSPVTFDYTPSDEYGLDYCELWGNWSLTFTEHDISTTANRARSVYAIDVDGDSDIDVLSASYNDDRIVWYENNGSESFTEHDISTTADKARDVYAIDVDNDSDIDVLSASYEDDRIAWYENNGSESFTEYNISTTANGANSVYAIDVDGDNDIDVLSSSYEDDRIVWYENNGTESFTEYNISTTADGANSVYAIDVDGDEDIDVLSASGTDDRIVWYENNGSESFTEHDISTTANSARDVYAIDVDGDGDIDVLSASGTDDRIVWYENNGTESFTEHDISTTADSARDVYAIDVDGDGDIDVLSASFNDDRIVWYENKLVWGSIKTDSSPTNGTINSFSSVSVDNGTWEWNVKCYDLGSNNVFASANWTFTIGAAGDTTPPVITITNPTNGSTINDDPVYLNATTDENADCEYSTTETFTYGTGTDFTITGTTSHGTSLGSLADNTYTYYVKCNDTSGNYNNDTNQASVTFTIDKTAPATVTNLANQSQGTTWIYWNWTSPSDADFSQAIIYIDSNNVANTSNNYYNATGLTADTSYTITVHTKDTSGNVNDTDVNSTASTLAEAAPQLNITSIAITPDDDEFTAGAQINPIEASNVTITLIANITNSSAIDSCKIRIWNSSDNYSSPTLSIVTGTIQLTGTQTQCNATWNMEYWRNSGDWNVSVDVNLTDSTSDNENSSYYYNVLTAHELNSSTVSFSGIPGQTVNSSDAYPLTVRNTGNKLINISLLGANFIGVTNSSYSIGVGNVTYNESGTGIFTELTSSYQMLYQLNVQETKEIYFRGYIPIGTLAQNYQANVSIRSE